MGKEKEKRMKGGNKDGRDSLWFVFEDGRGVGGGLGWGRDKCCYEKRVASREVLSNGVCVFVLSHKTLHTRSSQLSSIIYNSLSFSLATIPHSLSRQPSSPRPPPRLLHCLSPVMLLSILLQLMRGWVSTLHTLLSFITSLADVDLLTVRASRRGVFFPGGSLVWLCTPQLCGSLWHLLGELGHCSLTQLLTGSQFGSWEIFPFGCWMRRPCSVSGMMAKWFLLCVQIYRLHWRLHFMFTYSISRGGRFLLY